ncbi:MAG: RagB/SusD family nutrient uptake outer membrane protein [Bacteroidales bacterium]
MKRQFINSLLLLLIPVLFHCCEESLTLLPPQGKVKDEYWKSKEDVRATLMGAYKSLAMNDELFFYYGELRADMLKAGGNLSNELRDIMRSNIYASNDWTNWGSFYSVINYCNSVLKYSPEVKTIDGTFSDFDFQQYNAEAVFLRSLAYFYLVRVFKDVPFVLTPYDTDDQDFFPAKLSDDVILDSIYNHLTNILPVIPEEHETNDKTRGRATRGAVHALLADIALWRFDYQACINHIEFIENSDLYELVPGSNWFTIFSEGNTLEGIFELQFNSQLGQDNNMYNVTTPMNNYFLSSDQAFQMLSPTTSKEVIRGYGSVTDNELIWKYIGKKPDGFSLRSGTDRESSNWIVYRLADVLLMKAEALSQLGAYDEAIAVVNEIRARAFVATYSSYPQNAAALEELIIEERARELAFEGKRWFDLIRMGSRDDYERKNKLIEIIIKNVPATQKRVLATKLNDPYGWYLPIYEEELENNPNLVQNPYYQIY